MILLLFLACPEPTVCEEAALLDASVAVGTGAEGWDAIDTGEAVDVVWGPQGGVHVYGSLKLKGFLQGNSLFLSDPDNIRVSFQLVENKQVIGGYQELPRIFGEQGDTLWLVGEQVILDVPDLDALDGRAVELVAKVTDMCGRSGEGRASMVLRDTD